MIGSRTEMHAGPAAGEPAPTGPTPPGPRRAAYAALVLLQAGLFGGLSRTLLLPLAAGGAALFSLRTRRRGRMSRVQFLLTVGGIGAACLALWRLFPHRRPASDIEPELSAFGHALGQWALATQAVVLNLDWGRDERGGPRIPAVAPLAAVPVLLTAGDIRATGGERVAFLLASVAFALLLGVFFAAGTGGRRSGAAGRWPRRAALAGAALAVAGSTWAASATLRRYERTMDRVIRQFLQPEPLGVTAGFSGQTTLGDVSRRKAFAADDVALRAFAGAAPGYLRGRAFYTLEIGDGVTGNVTRWLGGEEEDRRRTAAGLPPVTALRVRRGDPTDPTRTAFVFDFRRPAAERSERQTGAEPTYAAFEPDGRAVEVWPAASFRGTIFAPPRTARLLAPQPVIDADGYGLTILTPVGLPHYVAEPQGQGGRGPDWRITAVAADPADPRCAEVPPVFAADDELADLADAIFAGRDTPAGQMAAVEAWFREKHRYQFGAELGGTGNPLRSFLLDRRAAHCEFFATAAAVLLRTRGVPTRYVTGFVAAEINPVGGYWVARNEDAHAWCEAWDPARGWVIVEATPPAGVPGPRQSPAFAQFWDAAAAAVARWRQTFTEKGGRWLLRAAGRFLLSGAGLGLLGCVLVPVAAAAWRQWRAGRAEDPTRRRARGTLRRLDRRFRRAGLVRDPGEPLHDFADRVREHHGRGEHAAAYAAAADALYRPA